MLATNEIQVDTNELVQILTRKHYPIILLFNYKYYYHNFCYGIVICYFSVK